MTSSRLSALMPGSLKHNDLVAALMRAFLRARTQRLEKVIFTATTGRSGTMTLAKLFSLVPECMALHEPYPIMNESVLRAASYGDTALVDRIYRQIKSINIRRAAVGYRYYMEANHLFLKTFVEQALEDFGERLAVVHLVRSPIDVAMSMHCLRHHPGSEFADAWYLDYKAPSNVIQISGLLDSTPEFAHPFFRCLWYWYEIELRFLAWHARFPMVKVAHFDTTWINDAPKVFRLLDDLGIDYEKSKVESIVGQREHTQPDLKVLPALPRTEAEEMHFRFQRLLLDRGLDISGLPQG